MQLKQKGQEVTVTLTKPERTILDKAIDLFEILSRVPCEQQGLAEATVDAALKLRAGFPIEVK